MRKFRTTICLSPADLVQILYCVLSLEFCLLLFRFPAEKKRERNPKQNNKNRNKNLEKKESPFPQEKTTKN